MGLSSVGKLVAMLCFALLLKPAGSPEEAVTAFVTAWNAQDLNKAAGMVVGGKPAADFANIKKLLPPTWMTVTLTNVKSEATGDKAKVSYHVKIDGPHNVPEKDETIDLVKVDDNWLIVPSGVEGGDNSYLPTLAALTTNPPVFEQANKAAKQAACLSNLKQLALGAIMLATDYDDKFKIDLSHVKAALHPYLKNDDLWYCPSVGKSQVAYTFNPSLANKSETAIEDPAKTVLIYEGSKGKLDFRHNGRAGVAFADGHAKMIDAEQAKALRWKP